MVELLSEALLVPQVSYEDWLGKLEASQTELRSEIQSNPALKLLEFYQSVRKLPPVADSAEAFGFPRLSTTLAAGRARSLHPPVLQPLDRKDVAAWISYWKSVGFLQVPAFDPVQYTNSLLTVKRGLGPYLVQRSSASRAGGQLSSSSYLRSSSVPISAISSQNFEQARSSAGLKAQILLILSNLLLWIRLALALPIRLLANLQSLDRDGA